MHEIKILTENQQIPNRISLPMLELSTFCVLFYFSSRLGPKKERKKAIRLAVRQIFLIEAIFVYPPRINSKMFGMSCIASAIMPFCLKVCIFVSHWQSYTLNKCTLTTMFAAMPRKRGKKEYMRKGKKLKHSRWKWKKTVFWMMP